MYEETRVQSLLQINDNKKEKNILEHISIGKCFILF